jgi:hypothetical protein
MSLETEIQLLRQAIETLTATMGAQKVLEVQEATVVPAPVKAKEVKEAKEPVKAKEVKELSHAQVQELCNVLNRGGVPATDLKKAVADTGAVKVAGVAANKLQDLHDALMALASQHKVKLA